MTTAIIDFTTYGQSVPEALARAGADSVLAGQDRILIKPNLVTDTPFPVTTSPECCGALIDAIRACKPDAEIIIAEGTGDPSCDTMEVFDTLGYTRLAAHKQIRLADLNTETLKKMKNPACRRLPEFWIPEIALSCFIISVPVLKVHTLAKVTGTLKNMMGFAPPSHYSGGGAWNKAALHSRLQEAISDLNCYRQPDFSLVDASVGMADSHLGGRQCDPPVGKLIAGFDPVAVDRAAAGLLGLNWQDIGHLKKPVL
ncbi:MAG: DUF362 domain-containing protein [Desulfobacterales bacterium]|nr:DUF362 domain-containing protein [Desulfobacterales bacterium]